MRLNSRFASLTLNLAFAITSTLPEFAAAQEHAWWAPDKVFIQAGHALDVNSLLIGTGSDFWAHRYASGQLTASWEADAGRWHVKSVNQLTETWVSQLGLTPSLRWQFGSSPWFVEGGIGANAIFPILHDTRKQFSTVFNFGDHLATGFRFGERRQHELSLRLEHFSNGGGKEPNPGDNFVELRYSYGF